MKIKSLMLTLFILLLFSCSDNNSTGNQTFKSEGIITGADARMCMCCGGYFIDISNVTYRFGGLPENSGIDFSKDSFPILVRLDWKKKDNPCMGDEIIIERIKKK